MTDYIITGPGAVAMGVGSVASGVTFAFSKPARVTIGDYCTISPGTRFVISGGDIVIGDWTSIHTQTLVLCDVGLKIGQHCWFGQNCVIDGSGGLYIGNGVRVGMYSQLWTHVAAGEQIEGCTLFSARPTFIEDDVWLVGSCICSSGIRVGHRTVALIGSNITKSCAPNSVLAGSPAKIKEGMSFYRPVSDQDKWNMLCQWLADYAHAESLRLDLIAEGGIVLSDASTPADGSVGFFRLDKDAESWRRETDNGTACSLESKSYNKVYNMLEAKVLKYLASNKARFLSKSTL